MSHQGHCPPCPDTIGCVLVFERVPVEMLRECLYWLSRPIRCDHAVPDRVVRHLLVEWHDNHDDGAVATILPADDAGNPQGETLDPVWLAGLGVDVSRLLT